MIVNINQGIERSADVSFQNSAMDEARNVVDDIRARLYVYKRPR